MGECVCYPGKCRRHATVPHNVTRRYGGLNTLWIRSQVLTKYFRMRLPLSDSSSGRTQPSRLLKSVICETQSHKVKVTSSRQEKRTRYREFKETEGYFVIVQMSLLHSITKVRISGQSVTFPVSSSLIKTFTNLLL